MTTKQETAAAISIDDLRTISNQIDTEFTQTFAGVFAQHRTWRKAADYINALTTCDTPVKTCWELAEKAGHDTPGPFQSLIAENAWDHNEIWKRIATSASQLLPYPADDPLGPGLAVDETAQLKRGRHTVATGIQWAGCLGRKANCVTSVFASYVTPRAATWIAHGLFLPKKDWFTGTGATGRTRRTTAGVPDDVAFETKPQIARRKFQELRDLGVHFTWATGDEVYGRYSALRDDHEKNGEAYAYFVPRNFLITTSVGSRRRADELGEQTQGHFEVRSAGPGRTGPRWYEWAMIEAGTPQHFLLIRRPLPRSGTPTADGDCVTTKNTTDADIPEGTSFVYCHVPKDSPISPTLPNLVLMAGRRWPVEETIATGKGPLGWDHNQYRTWTSLAHHTALCGLAMLKAIALRARLENTSAFPFDPDHPDNDIPPADDLSTPGAYVPPPTPGWSPDAHDDLMIPRGDSLIPVRPNRSCPADIGYIRLTVNETLRLVGIANAGLSTARMAFHLRWSRWRRRHQAIARWHRYRARLTAQAAPT
ncbi:MAG: IS701 family transposase [Actinobacteria bacterium]|nr:IS701 family transposase [Actinomycetota bacterium]